MLVVMEEGAREQQIQAVIDRMVALGLTVHRSTGIRHTVLGGVGPSETVDLAQFLVMPGVKECHRIAHPFKLAARAFRPQGTIIKAGRVEIGGEKLVMMAGPCAVESEDQIEQTAEAVARAGAAVLRGGAFKPRTSPYTFRGLGEPGLRLLRAAADRHSLLVVTEVMDASQIGLVAAYADILQVGARNMQNFHLLQALGAVRKPVLLKRGPSATLEELLLAAEYILAGGNYDVILCERGIRTFDTSLRYTMDIPAIPVLRKLTHLPVVADPSHATGRRDMVPPMARAAVAAGADGLLVEVHCDPDHALSDGAQSLTPEEFSGLMGQLRAIAAVVGRKL